jgi:hypothetical protein
VVEKNFIILTCKFGGNKALHAQHGLPLSYGSKFKPILILEPIFGFHSSWTKMKMVITCATSREVSKLKPLPHDDMDAQNKLITETGLTEQKIILGWSFDFCRMTNLPSRTLKSNLRNHRLWLDIKRRTGNQHWEMGPPWTNHPASTLLPQQIALPKTESREQVHDNG